MTGGRKNARECPQQRRALPDIAQYRADMSIYEPLPLKPRPWMHSKCEPVGRRGFSRYYWVIGLYLYSLFNTNILYNTYSAK